MTKLESEMDLITGGVLSLSGPVGSDVKTVKKALREKVRLAETAKVTVEQAIRIASRKVPGKVIEVALEHQQSKAVWVVDVVAPDGRVMEMHLDAFSGRIIDMEEEGVKKQQRKQKIAIKN